MPKEIHDERYKWSTHVSDKGKCKTDIPESYADPLNCEIQEDFPLVVHFPEVNIIKCEAVLVREGLKPFLEISQ